MSGLSTSYFTLVTMYGIFNKNQHLLIIDGHNSHATLDVVHTA